MKLLTKIAVAVLILGGVLFAAGHAMGGTVYSSWYDGGLHPWQESRSVGWGTDEPVTGETAFADDRVRSLSFDLKHGDYTIARGQEFSITGTDLEILESQIEDDTWYISCQEDRPADSGRTVTITLPQDFQPEQFELDIGMGAASVCALTADYADWTVGAGSLTAGTLAVSELDLHTGTGSAAVDLAGVWSDYCYDATAEMGEIQVNGQTLAGGIDSEAAGGSGPIALDLSCGMGAITLTTVS